MFKHKIHICLFSFVLLFSLASFSGYANSNEIAVTKIELVHTDTTTTYNDVFYVDALQKIAQRDNNNLFCGYSFSSFLLANNSTNRFTIKSRQFTYTTFKVKQLELFLKPLQNQTPSYFLMFL
ncbi:hypothetical protein [Olleya sp. R77988]|uniref:hypothetical protein n=1 Tax=Olleya sp. R77988 TaxID=3093875 RepID=UPI0037C6DDCA